MDMAVEVSADASRALENLESYEIPFRTEKYANLIRSAHGSFRQEMVRDREPLSFRALPGTRKSTEILGMFRHATGYLLDHFVFYTRDQDQPADYRFYDDFADRSFQPKARDWKGLWGISQGIEAPLPVPANERNPYPDLTLEEMVEMRMQQYGFTSITYDTIHSQVTSGNGERFENPLLLAQRLSARGLINGVHVALNRQDITKNDPALAKSTREAQEAFVESTDAALETLEGKMLLSIAEDWNTQEQHAGKERLVVLEEAPDMTLNSSKIQDRQAAIVNSIRGILAEAA